MTLCPPARSCREAPTATSATSTCEVRHAFTPLDFLQHPRDLRTEFLPDAEDLTWHNLSPTRGEEASPAEGTNVPTTFRTRALDTAHALSHRLVKDSRAWVIEQARHIAAMEGGGSSSSHGGFGDDSDWPQAGAHAAAQDLAGPGEHGRLECTVNKPQREGEGTQNSYISYLVATEV